MESLRILLLGSGAREHALAWKLNKSTRVEIIYALPGNGGTASGLSKVKNIVDVSPDNFADVIAFARDQRVNLVVPGPEAPLVAGIEGFCRAAGLRCFGPTKQAARMEGSKAFAKEFMTRHRIPTARFKRFRDYKAAKEHLGSVDYKVVIKADGLAAGKGVIIPDSLANAQEAIEAMMLSKSFGAAGEEIVIEEFLEGQELSVLTFSDGYTSKSLPLAQDHKHVYDGDKGPMTGGMGCYAPTPLATPQLLKAIDHDIIRPTISGMRQEGFPFLGMLFIGLMITSKGPHVLEYNVRFGDPECETLIPLLSDDTDLADILVACTDRYLDAATMKIDTKFSATVIAVAGGYPGVYKKGDGIDIGTTEADTVLFHAGTSSSSGTLRTAGGRVIASTATGVTLQSALDSAYRGVSAIKFANIFYRKDIGHHALNRNSNEATSDSYLQFESTFDRPSKESLTYASSGVDIEAGNSLVSLIKPLVASTARSGADASIGGFGGLFSLPAAGYSTVPTLIGGIDGVGTKLSIAQAYGKHDTVGIDCVAMNANDLVVQGAEVLFFLDCYTCGKLDVKIAADFVKGVAEGCKQAGCALIGGETAEMPGMFAESGDAGTARGDMYDAVGAAVGAIGRDCNILPNIASMRIGDMVLGISSSGCHSNGFSLIRKILRRSGLTVRDLAPWDRNMTVGESLLTPTRIYVKPLLEVTRRNLIKGLAHITGGGLIDNIPRMLPPHLTAELDVKRWEIPPVMEWLKREGGVEPLEFARTWNTGLGMVLIVAESDAATTIKILEEQGEKIWKIGRLIERQTSGGCVLKSLDSWH